MSGLVRGNRRKAVFAFKGRFPKGICRVSASGQWDFAANFGSAGKNRNTPSTPRFLPTKPQVADPCNRGLVDTTRFFTALLD